MNFEHFFYPNSPDTIQSKRREWVHKNAEKLIHLSESKPKIFSIEDTIAIGDTYQEPSTADKKLIHDLIPWRKGPFQIDNCFIDSEWRSDVKWQRLSHIDLRDKVVCDIGCNNGYFMFRMAEQGAKTIIGLEPVPAFFNQFCFIQNMIQMNGVFFEPVGIQDIDDFNAFFDHVFCLGILYHHTDPVGMLRKIKSALKPKATLIVDCQSIPHDDAVCLVPEKTYAGAHGIWFLPSQQVLKHWLSRAGFRDIEIFYHEPLSIDEQRSTTYAPYPSLAENLDPQDSTRTREGYPAPWRTYVSAKK
jgi:tRNA (mo5U34)-methyltransferase